MEGLSVMPPEGNEKGRNEEALRIYGPEGFST